MKQEIDVDTQRKVVEGGSFCCRAYFLYHLRQHNRIYFAGAGRSRHVCLIAPVTRALIPLLGSATFAITSSSRA